MILQRDQSVTPAQPFGQVGLVPCDFVAGEQNPGEVPIDEDVVRGRGRCIVALQDV